MPLNLLAKKKKKKKSILIEWYHNTTARYNGYFYAKLTMQESEQLLMENLETNFDKFLELYPTISSPNKQSISGQMQTVIEKSEKVIQKHKKSKWVDDCNLLIGKSYVYLGEYESALKNLLYITSDYYNTDETNNSKKKKKKRRRRKRRKKSRKNSKDQEVNKVEELLQQYNITHQHAYHWAIIWLLLTFVENQDFQKAMIVADLVLNKSDLSDREKTDLYITQSHIFIKSGNITNAILPLKKAIILSKKKKERVKLHFLLGQIYLELKQTNAAIDEFNKVLDLKPDYEFEFNAKLKIASTFQEMSSGTNASIKKLVYEMIDDENNEDQLDKLYYTLGNISMTENEVETALMYYKKSIENSIENKHQKGLSYLKIGEYKLLASQYVEAAINFDSTIQNLQKEYKEYEEIYKTQNKLQVIKENIENIAFQDSIQDLSKLDKAVIMEMIDEKIEKRKALIEKEQAAQLARLNAQPDNSTTTRPTRRASKNTQWYFYNQNTKTIGYQTFKRSWGNRKLEDNWRRKSKDSNIEDEDEENTVKDESQLLDPNYYYSLIPNTPEKIENSNLSIRNSLNLLGINFRSEIENIELSISYFEELLARFPNDNNLDKIYFYLYHLYKEQSNLKASDKYLELLFKNFPNSIITQSLKDNPITSNKVKEQYELAYNYFNQSDYQNCITACNEALLDIDHEFEVKYKFIKAKSYGYLGRKDSMIRLLQQIVKNHPKHPLKPKADDILALLSNSSLYNSQTFIYQPLDRHFACFILSPQDFQSTNLTVELSAFNKRVFKRKNYQLVNIEFNGQKMIIVKSFEKIEDVMNYLEAIKKDNKLKKLLKKLKHEQFAVGKKNYGILMNTFNLDGYKEFFDEYYK